MCARIALRINITPCGLLWGWTYFQNMSFHCCPLLTLVDTKPTKKPKKTLKYPGNTPKKKIQENPPKTPRTQEKPQKLQEIKITTSLILFGTRHHIHGGVSKDDPWRSLDSFAGKESTDATLDPHRNECGVQFTQHFLCLKSFISIDKRHGWQYHWNKTRECQTYDDLQNHIALMIAPGTINSSFIASHLPVQV